jgi:dienelactone hydrolase
MLQTSKIEYVQGDTVLEGYCVLDDSYRGSRPAVIVAPDWSGRNDFACQKAEQLAELGYVGFALDMYGQGKVADTKEERTAAIAPLMADRSLLAKRVLAAFDVVSKLEAVNTASIGAIGFCFGGLCVLDLARHGAPLRGVVSFHGLLNAPKDLPDKKIHARILVLHGHEDPMVPPAQVADFQNEMTAAGVDWQIDIYGHTRHAFTNPKQHDVASGLVYNNLADKRSWIAMRDFFNEIFS